MKAIFIYKNGAEIPGEISERFTVPPVVLAELSLEGVEFYFLLLETIGGKAFYKEVSQEECERVKKEIL